MAGFFEHGNELTCSKCKGKVPMHVMKSYGGVEIQCHSLWRGVVSFTPPTALSPAKSHRFPSKRNLGGPQGQTGRFRDEKIRFPLPGIKPRFVCHSASSLVAIPAELSLFPGSKGAGNLYSSLVRIKFRKILFSGFINTLISALKIEAVCSPVTFVSAYQTTRRHIEDHNMDLLHSLRHSQISSMLL
jgi:hypothetical protein